MEIEREHFVASEPIPEGKGLGFSGQSHSERPQTHGFLRPAYGPLNDSGMMVAIANVEKGKRISPEAMAMFEGTPIANTLRKFVAPQK